MVRDDKQNYQPDREDILADDWMLEPDEVMVPRSRLEQIARRMLVRQHDSLTSSPLTSRLSALYQSLIDDALLELGFK